MWLTSCMQLESSLYSYLHHRITAWLKSVSKAARKWIEETIQGAVMFYKCTILWIRKLKCRSSILLFLQYRVFVGIHLWSFIVYFLCSLGAGVLILSASFQRLIEPAILCVWVHTSSFSTNEPLHQRTSTVFWFFFFFICSLDNNPEVNKGVLVLLY